MWHIYAKKNYSLCIGNSDVSRHLVFYLAILVAGARQGGTPGPSCFILLGSWGAESLLCSPLPLMVSHDISVVLVLGQAPLGRRGQLNP